MQTDKNLYFYGYLSISFFFTLFFYRLHKFIVDESTDIDQVGYVDYKHTVCVFKLIFLLFLSSRISNS
jgi:hypothetical protein